MGRRKKFVTEYEQEAAWLAGCLIHSAFGAARKVFQRRHDRILPSSLCVCHTCDNPSCILDEHHFLGTHLDNMRDATAKGKFVRTSSEMRSKYTGSNNGMYGRRHTTAARKAMSKARKGLPFTAEHLANLAAANKSEKRRKEMSEQRKGVPLSKLHLANLRKAAKNPESRTKKRMSHLGKKTDPEVIARIAKKNTGQTRTSKQIRRMRTAQRKSWIRRKEERMLLQSGYGHLWRLATLSTHDQVIIEAM
jgi:hypothetical protein